MITGAAFLIPGAWVTPAVIHFNEFLVKSQQVLLASIECRTGRKFSAREFYASFRDRTGRWLRGVSWGDDPAFSQGPFVRADDVQIGVGFALLLRHEFKIKELSCPFYVSLARALRDSIVEFADAEIPRVDRRRKVTQQSPRFHAVVLGSPLQNPETRFLPETSSPKAMMKASPPR